MKHWTLLGFVLVSAAVGATGTSKMSDSCDEYVDSCSGEGYYCTSSGVCRCIRGYVPNPEEGTCILCPRYGEQCFGQCCSSRKESLHCWEGICQPCHDSHGTWTCGDQNGSISLTSATQIAMAAALVLGILATFVLLYKLCAASDINSFGRQSHNGTRLSVGSLQLYVDERLRDAPPRYSRAPPPGVPPIFPLHGQLNSGFIHDSSVPPPPYTGPPKDEETAARPALHI